MPVRYYDWIAHFARRTPHKVAAVDLASERRFTYVAFDARIARLASHLREELTISRGEGYWLIPALYLPTGSYIGGSTREECEALERRQGRNLPLPPQGFCRSANVRPAP